jgi:hypothetical protein
MVSVYQIDKLLKYRKFPNGSAHRLRSREDGPGMEEI